MGLLYVIHNRRLLSMLDSPPECAAPEMTKMVFTGCCTSPYRAVLSLPHVPQVSGNTLGERSVV
jgi:hypothetical protein